MIILKKLDETRPLLCGVCKAESNEIYHVNGEDLCFDCFKQKYPMTKDEERCVVCGEWHNCHILDGEYYCTKHFVKELGGDIYE